VGIDTSKPSGILCTITS